VPGDKPMRADARRNRELILNAAAVVLARDVDVTLLDIAGEAGVSRATIYRHFSDVDGVRAALLEEVQELAKELLQKHLAVDPQGPKSFSEQMVDMVATALPIRTRYAEAMAKDPVPDAGMTAMFKPVLQAMIRQAQDRSEVRADLDAGTMAEAVISIGFYTSRRVYRDGLPVATAMQVFETFMRGMETSPGRK
jgi:AcrR family transcriptional regulator